LARCGDGIRRVDVAVGSPGYEECDDGNRSQTDDCLVTCESAGCGDGHVWLGEERCDDGNDNEEDACLEGCIPARCGDGIQRRDLRPGDAGFEACDDG
ncbi:MAG TPA: hypothetical protein DEB46_07130, partial [Myxococcales bacterium]|nr:hypothetical protein [Myxococcales bacterium]